MNPDLMKEIDRALNKQPVIPTVGARSGVLPANSGHQEADRAVESTVAQDFPDLGQGARSTDPRNHKGDALLEGIMHALGRR